MLLGGQKLSIGIIIFAGLVGCSQDRQKIRWSAGEPKPKALSSEQFQTLEQKASTKEFEAQLFLQRIHGVAVEDGYLSRIYDSTGKLTRAQGQSVSVREFATKERLDEVMKREELIINKARDLNQDFGKAQEILHKSWVIRPGLGGEQLILQVAYLPESEDHIVELSLSPTGQILSQQKVSRHLDSGIARVFPEGPILSPISVEKLKELRGDGTLSNQYVKVESAYPLQAKETDHDFSYEEEDPRFDEVQAFYHADRFLDYYRKYHGLKLPFRLEIQVGVGYPKRKNVAFYYRGKVRLGAGDDITYKNMTHDPSIVMHESAHALTDAFAGLDFENETGSINEGFSDYFAANVLGTSKMAEASYLKASFRREIDNLKTTDDFTDGLYEDSLIVSGSLWEIRKSIGEYQATRFALKALSYLGPNSEFSDLREAFQKALSSLTKSNQAKTALILRKRGWL